MKPSKPALFDAAKRWDAASLKALLKAAPDLVHATDRQGRSALHVACAVKPAKGLGESHGIRTVTALLAAGADLEAHVPMPAEEGDFRANPVWYAASRARTWRGQVPAQARG
jgi:uncharacterized protein